MPAKIKMDVSLTGSVVEIDANGTKGGNVRGRSFRKVVWKAGANVDKFDLAIVRLDDMEGALAADPDWPFLSAKVDGAGSSIDEDAATVTAATKFSARLADPGTYKYSVTAYSGANSYTLDPIIIIER